MAKECRVAGCRAHTTSFGNYCPSHKSALRRHGHPEQDAVTKAELKPYIALVRRRIEKNAESTVWQHCETRWLAVVDHARGIVAEAEHGRPGFGFERRAAEEVLKLAGAVEARSVVEVVFALYLMQDADPRRFRSDEAFRFQLARRVRGLVEGNACSWVDPASGRAKRAYVELSPRAAKSLSRWLVEAFGGIGLHLARMEQQDREAEQARRKDLGEALKELV